MTDNLRSKAVRAIGVTGASGMVLKLLSLINTVVLARLLSPDDYGLMAMAGVVIGLVGFFNEIGVGAAIVQKAEINEEELNGCFLISLILSIFLFALTAGSSGLIADFFGNKALQPVVAVLASGFIIGGLSTVPQALLRKHLRFNQIAVWGVLAVASQLVVSLVLALLGFRVWSLVWANIVFNVVQTLGYFLAAGWWPKGKASIRSAYSLIVYGLHVTTSRVLWYIYSNADKAIIGRLLGAKSLGIYDMAISLATLPTVQITALVTNIASPVFAKIQDDPPRLAAVALKLTRGVAYITYPALIGLMSISYEMITVILGDRWVDMLIPFSALCLMGLIKSVDPLLSQLLISTGHVKKLNFYTGLCCVVMSVGVLVGAYIDGLRGVSAVWIVVYPILSAKLLYDSCKVTGMAMMDYYRTLAPVALGAAFMGVVVYLGRWALLALGVPPVWVLVSEVIIGALSYSFWMIYVNSQAVAEVYQILQDFGISAQKLQRWPFNRIKEN